MDKIIGFALTREPNNIGPPPWLSRFPWVKIETRNIQGWKLTLWGRGDLGRFIKGGQVVVGYSNSDYDNLSIFPLQNRGLLIELSEEEATIANDALGMLPCFYASKNGAPYVSTCEESVVRALGGVTLGRDRLASYLTFQMAAATLTLWSEINKLYANRILKIGADGSFQQIPQPPLQFQPMDGDMVARMAEMLRDTVRLYTDPLEDVFLPLSHGHDSRLLLCSMARPERIHARTYPLSQPAERAFDVVIAKESARLMGVDDHRIINFGANQLSDYTQASIEVYGTPLAATQVYVYGAAERLGREQRGWSVISGVNGDEHAGVAVRRSASKLSESDPAQKFRSACYCWVKEWSAGDLDSCLAYDWRSALQPAREVWAEAWRGTEGDDLIRHAHLIHTRNRGSQYLAYSWAACDLWGGLVTPYNDRRYVEFSLSLPKEYRENRYGQARLFERYFPEVWPTAGLPDTAYDYANTLDRDGLRKAKGAALWPLIPDGSKPAHGFFKKDGIRRLYEKAVGGDTHSYYLLNSLQPLAWAFEKGFVR